MGAKRHDYVVYSSEGASCYNKSCTIKNELRRSFL
jgi:hypothetical protein